MARFSYEEMQEMVNRWVQANRESGQNGNSWEVMSEFYTDDAIYSWNYGPKDEFVARGKDQLRDWAFGLEMAGLDGWRYPYIRTLIDPVKGEFVGFWRQLAPEKNPDTGKSYEIVGTGGSWFRYAGNFKWCWQRDFFDLGNATDCFIKMMTNNHLSPGMTARLNKLANGERRPGWVKLSEFDWLTTLADPEDI